MQRIVLVLTTLGLVLLAPFARADQAMAPVHALSMYGQPKYGPAFAHFDYVNPNAPKGGKVKLATVGTFDTLNPFTLKGVAAAGSDMLFDTLMVSSADEPFTEYGLVAKSVEVPPDRSWVIFDLRPEARFHDGSPITAADVVFSFNILKTKGHPFYASYYANVAKAEALGPHKVKFVFMGGQNRELPLIIGQLPIVSKAYWQGKDFAATTLKPPLGSGPYEVTEVDQGRSITYRRVKNYWAANLPVNRGRYNFDTIRYDYYRDSTVALEAFKAGEYDFRQENSSKAWATGYDSPALKAGMIKKALIPNHVPQGMQGFVYNTRRAVFKDRGVRQALAYAFDFPWTNKTLFYGAYTRTRSYFSNSDLAATGLPSPAELKLLDPYRDQLPPAVFDRVYEPPTTDGSGNIRANLRTAFELLGKAGWHIRDGKMVNAKTGQPLQFQILLVDPAFERVVLPFKNNLARLGIGVSVRTVDVAQYQQRLDNFDFDMVVSTFAQSLSPGNEQRDFWGSKAARTPGSQNLAGTDSPVVDALINKIVSAPDRPSLIAACRALDRVLQWSFYVIPQWHLTAFRVAYWDKFMRPADNPPYALGFDTWWVDPAKMAKVQQWRTSGR